MQEQIKKIDIVDVPDGNQVFTKEFNDLLIELHNQFSERIHDLLNKRTKVLDKAHTSNILPTLNPESIACATNWSVLEVPKELRTPGIEISGPASQTSMFINALNPGPDGDRAEGDLDDDEDSAGHTLESTVRAAINRRDAAKGVLSFVNEQRQRTYTLQEGNIPFFMHRERGIHLFEFAVQIDGEPISAALLGTALTLRYCGEEQASKGQGIYFYLPKLESASEAALWKDVFDFMKLKLPFLQSTHIKAIPLIESLPAVFEMEEILYSLGEYAAGLNAARWDLKASILEYVMTDPSQVWPDRFDVDIKTTPFLANIFRRLVAICLKHNAVAIGGMATALPSNNEEINDLATKSITADKEWEANQGFIRAWVAHIFHMKTAAAPFKNLHHSNWIPSEDMHEPQNYPISIEVPEGNITSEGTRRNCRMLIEYIEGWLDGKGAKGIDSLQGKPGIRPALMEDLATGRISVAQIAQRIIHQSIDTETEFVHTAESVKTVLQSELTSILKESEPTDDATKTRYKTAYKVALRWIRNYIELDFRSLGSYSVAELINLGHEDDAL